MLNVTSVAAFCRTSFGGSCPPFTAKLGEHAFSGRLARECVNVQQRWCRGMEQRRNTAAADDAVTAPIQRNGKVDGDARVVATDGGSNRAASEDGQLQRHRRYHTTCPFFIRRTGADNLPVYVYKRLNRNHDVTVIRKMKGDAEEFRRELEFICRCRVTVGKSGFFEVPGNHRRVIKEYFKSIGF
eukprot:TRINITY_DN7220_c0_g1_i1.p1 TRINITY_DN7220_c0_g1~~TRINITY_DN7220_c0_g1_i1.p1  ORF type:complete len:185 (+),score=23.84 TRINITY_DN7220_c0_g1_i1:76-630(+)